MGKSMCQHDTLIIICPQIKVLAILDINLITIIGTLKNGKLIVSDSIAKRIGHDSVKGATLCAYPGKTFSGIGDLLINGGIDIKDVGTILLHVGTNDIDNLRKNNDKVRNEMSRWGHSGKCILPEEDIVQGFVALVKLFKQFCSGVTIIFSAILPRIVDMNKTDAIIRKVNTGIKDYCHSHDNLIFNPTFKWFVHKGAPLSSYFASRDGLHLSDMGSNRLRQAFQMALADKNIAQQSHCSMTKKHRKRGGARPKKPSSNLIQIL